MTFWVISEQYYPQETATGYLLTELAEEMARHVETSVLCSMPPVRAGGQPSPARETRRGASIYRCPATSLDKDRLWLRLINLLTISGSILIHALARLRPGDCVLVVTNPPSLPFVVALACKLRRARCILLIYDVYPEVLVATGLARPGGALVRVLGWLTRLLYRSVDHIAVLGRDMARLVAEKLGVTGMTPEARRGAERIAVIPNWADLDQVFPTPRAGNALLNELGLLDKFVVGYAGNLGRPNDIESLVASAQLLRHVPDVHFLFIGSGAKRAWLEQAVARDQLENVTVLPSRPRSDQCNFINACDIAVVSLVKGMTGLAVPSRSYNILAAGKPILGIVGADSEVALMIQEDRVGRVVSPGYPEEIVQAILDARAHPEDWAEMGRRARQAAARYSLSRAVRSFLDLIAQIRPEPGLVTQKPANTSREFLP